MRRAALILSVAATVCTGQLAAQRPSRDCALTYEVPRGTDAAYRARGGRCEGVFVQPVAGSTRLFLRGFHLGIPAYDLDRARSLSIEVLGTPAAGGTLVARSMRPRHFYQMDTRAFDTSGNFTWDTEVLRHADARVSPAELAVLYSVGTDASDSLNVWPVRVRGEGGDVGPALPFLVLEAETELASVIVQVNRSGGGETVDQRTIERRFPADYAIRICLRVPGPGAYDVSLTAVGPYGSRARTWFTAVVPGGDLERCP
jgi:hypothetical protein